jgi:hypothetical protein
MTTTDVSDEGKVASADEEAIPDECFSLASVEDAGISVELDVLLSTVAGELSAVDEGKGTSVDTNGVTVPEYLSAGSIDDPGISVELDVPLSTVARELSAVDKAVVACADNNGVTVPDCLSAGTIDDPGSSVEVYEACGTAG